MTENQYHRVEGFGQSEDSMITKSAAWLATACAIVTKEPSYADTYSDPFAIRFAEAISDIAAAELAKLDETAVRHAFITEREMDHAGVVGTVLYRKPWFETQTETALKQEADQLVILGAGCDTLSLRLAAKSMFPNTFELDRPEVIEFRNQVLETAPLNLSHVTRIGLDFQTRFFGDVLMENGYKTDQRSVFVAEGVLEYLSNDAVDAVFKFIRTKATAGSTIVFSFTESTVGKEYQGKDTGKPLLGESRTWEITPDSLEAFLSSRGFDLLNMLSPEEAEAHWLPKSGPKVRAVPFMYLASAQTHSK